MKTLIALLIFSFECVFSQNFWQQSFSFNGSSKYAMAYTLSGNLLVGSGERIYKFDGTNYQTANFTAHGYVYTLAVDPKNGYVYAGAEAEQGTLGGVYISYDEGINWSAAGLAGKGISEIVVDSGGVVIASVYQDNNMGYLFRSTNRGATWTTLFNNASSRIHCVAKDKNNNLYTGVQNPNNATDAILYKSPNRGVTWNAIKTFNNAGGNITSIGFDTSGNNILVHLESERVLLSTDNGSTWAEKLTGLNYFNKAPIAVNKYNHIFIGAYGSGIYRSKNGGVDWEQLNSGLANTYVLSLAAKDDYVYCGTSSPMFKGQIVSPPMPPTLKLPLNNSTNIPLSVSLEWNSAQTATAYKIQVSKEQQFINPFIDLDVSDLKYVASNLENNTQYFWHVRAKNSEGSSSWSETWKFNTIPLKTIHLILPNGGENLKAGSKYNITWTSAGITSIKISYTINSASWQTVEENVPASSGSYSWTVPNTPSNQCKVKIADVSDIAASDESDNNFAIVQDNHFTTVWSSPYQPMNIYIKSATLNNIPCEAGDEIGIYDGEYCVGAKRLSSIIPEGLPLSIIASKDDPVTTIIDGFYENHPITYRIWDNSEQKEYSNVSPVYEQGNSGLFVGLGSAIVSLQNTLSYTITTLSNPANGGTTNGGGSYNFGQSATVNAFSANGYTFTNWTENGSVVSENTNYTFIVNSDRILTANFLGAGPAISLSNSTGNANDSVLISLYAQNLLNIGAITIKIQYDPVKLVFGRALNLDSQLTGALAGGNAGGTVTIVWDALTGANFPNNKIADLKFLFKGSASPTPVTFLTAQCEISDPNGNILSNISYRNGNVTETKGFQISGQVVYANTAITPLSNVKVYLKTAESVIDSSIADQGGNYSFIGKVNGAYSLSCICAKPWGGVTSTDALLIRQYIAGLKSFDDLQIKASDLNVSLTVTSTDALLLRKRIAWTDSIYKAGDWVFESPSININGTDVVQKIRGLCTGDVNASYMPALSNSMPAIVFRQNRGSANLLKSNQELPVIVDENIMLGALTLIINYPQSKVDIINVESKLNGLLASYSNGKITLAWDDITPMHFQIGEPLCILKLKLKNNTSNISQTDFSYAAESEFADSEGNIIEKEIISLPPVSNDLIQKYDLSQNYPNPFNPTTTIKYSVPVQSFVRLVAYNVLGSIVKEFYNGVKVSGNYETIFDADGLSSGIYFISMSAKAVDGSDNFTSVRKLILIK